MTTALYPSLLDEQLVEVSAHNMREAYAVAERLGCPPVPVEQYTERCHGGAVLHVLRFERPGREDEA